MRDHRPRDLTVGSLSGPAGCPQIAGGAAGVVLSAERFSRADRVVAPTGHGRAKRLGVCCPAPDAVAPRVLHRALSTHERGDNLGDIGAPAHLAVNGEIARTSLQAFQAGQAHRLVRGFGDADAGRTASVCGGRHAAGPAEQGLRPARAEAAPRGAAHLDAGQLTGAVAVREPGALRQLGVLSAFEHPPYSKPLQRHDAAHLPLQLAHLDQHLGFGFARPIAPAPRLRDGRAEPGGRGERVPLTSHPFRPDPPGGPRSDRGKRAWARLTGADGSHRARAMGAREQRTLVTRIGPAESPLPVPPLPASVPSRACSAASAACRSHKHQPTTASSKNRDRGRSQAP